jgi:hypothetical protein
VVSRERRAYEWSTIADLEVAVAIVRSTLSDRRRGEIGMSSIRSFTPTIRLAFLCWAVTLILSNAHTAWAQAADGLFDLVDILSFNEDRQAPGRRVALSGDTAVVFRTPLFPSLRPRI